MKKLTGKRNIKSFAKIDVQYQKTTYEVLFCKYHTASDFLLLDFLEGLISNRKFRKTTQQQQPFEDTIDITLSDTYAFLSSEEFQSFRDVDNDFYHFFKQRYLTELAFNRWRGFISRIALYT
ncbi:MAG: hypothetical protein LBG59_06820 [Candidatus Peribacteria bacterium]|nr:hypothetical protein [Candidatus Peribacteria bacterium]